jgi:hypothetical protein
VPSTLNRLVTLVRPNNPIFGLVYVSGLVLPLQGSWNAIIYISTSWPACKAFVWRITTALNAAMAEWSILNDSCFRHEPRSNNQPAGRSESVQELHSNTGDGLGIEME